MTFPPSMEVLFSRKDNGKLYRLVGLESGGIALRMISGSLSSIKRYDTISDALEEFIIVQNIRHWRSRCPIRR